MKNDLGGHHIIDQIRQALEKTTLTKTIEPDAYAEAAQQFVDEYGTALYTLLVNDALQENAEKYSNQS